MNGQRERINHFGEKAFGLSEKQVDVIARDIDSLFTLRPTPPGMWTRIGRTRFQFGSIGLLGANSPARRSAL